MKRVLILSALISISMIVMNCGGGDSSNTDYPRFSSIDNEIVNFSFPSSENSKLSSDFSGIITDSIITIEVPASADLSSLIAEFTINSGKVEVNGVTQVSGVTVNNFLNPVEYTVTSESGDKRTYSVVVKKAPSKEKDLKSFSINGIDGQIDEAAETVTVELPPKTSKMSLTAMFETAGKTVKIGDTVQSSGVTSNNYTSPVVYIITAGDGSTKEYTVTVNVRKDSSNSLSIFRFNAIDNPSLDADVNGIITDDNIKLMLPYGTVSSALKAYFETSGEFVKIGNQEQTAGLTVNDFTSALEYSVIAENGDSRKYNVEVSIAKSDAKQITVFLLDGESALIDEGGKGISVKFPSSKILTDLTASYVSTGVEVKAGGVVQVSGITANNFSSPVVYTVKADDGSSADYTVTALKSEEIAGIWNFDYGTDGSYQISGADVVDGVSGNALYFNRGDYVLVPDSEYLTLADSGTIEAVIKADSHQPFAGVVHKGIKKDFSDESYSLQFWGNNGTDGTLRISVFNSSGENNYIDSDTKLSTGVWYYVAATWDSSEIKLYVNGNLEGSIPNSIGKVRDSAGALVIGAQLPVAYNSSWSNLVFNGAIDRVQISNRALTDQEIFENYRKLPFSSISALPAYILGVAVKNLIFTGGIFGILIIILFGIFIYNRRRA
jgi:hypothetical protein